MSVLTFKYRIRSGERKLVRHARATNIVWNYCVSVTREAQRRRRSWPTAFDLINLNADSAALLGIYADTIGCICRQFVQSRNKSGRCPRFRSNFGRRRSLGWIPFQGRSVRIEGNSVAYLKSPFRFWKSRELGADCRSGAFVQDARGRWYVTLQCQVADDLQSGTGEVGIDLGLKALATLSDGTSIPALQHYRKYEQSLAVAQRARRKGRARAISAKIANARRHHLHEQSTRIARENRLIAVGDVSSSKLAKTKMAKSVLDAGWGNFRHMLRYKAARRQAVYVDVDERWSSQTCSACGSLPPSRPRGIAGLGMRHWECSDCGAPHDRDVNAARNILRAGLEHQPPVGEIADGERANRYSPPTNGEVSEPDSAKGGL